MNKEQAFLEAQKMFEEQIAELKQQLEEKEKGIAEINKFISLFNCDDFNDFEIFFGACMLAQHEQETLIIDLQRQLHTQPKEIVEKIRNDFEERMKNTLWNAEFPVGKVCNMINDVLDEILKEYGGE